MLTAANALALSANMVSSDFSKQIDSGHDMRPCVLVAECLRAGFCIQMPGFESRVIIFPDDLNLLVLRANALASVQTRYTAGKKKKVARSAEKISASTSKIVS